MTPLRRLRRIIGALTLLAVALGSGVAYVASRPVANQGCVIDPAKHVLAVAGLLIGGLAWVLAIFATQMLTDAERSHGDEPFATRLTRRSLEPPLRRPRTGATLISVLAAMAIVAVCLTLVLQAYVHGGRFVALQQQRVRAAASCQLQIEQARARGFAALPAVGSHSFDAGSELQGTLTVAAGPREGARTVTVRASWSDSGRVPAGHVELTTIMTARGRGG